MTTNDIRGFLVRLEDNFTMYWGMSDLVEYLEQYGVVTVEDDYCYRGWLSKRAVDPELPHTAGLRIYWTRPGLRTINFYVYGKGINENYRYDVVAAVKSYLKHRDGN